jgi:hypothetical protein
MSTAEPTAAPIRRSDRSRPGSPVTQRDVRWCGPPCIPTRPTDFIPQLSATAVMGPSAPHRAQPGTERTPVLLACTWPTSRRLAAGDHRLRRLRECQEHEAVPGEDRSQHQPVQLPPLARPVGDHPQVAEIDLDFPAGLPVGHRHRRLPSRSAHRVICDSPPPRARPDSRAAWIYRAAVSRPPPPASLPGACRPRPRSQHLFDLWSPEPPGTPFPVVSSRTERTGRSQQGASSTGKPGGLIPVAATPSRWSHARPALATRRRCRRRGTRRWVRNGGFC